MDCVSKRGKVYCAVISVPVDLQKSIGKKQIWRSLKTKNYSAARSQARKLLLAVDQLFMQIRTNMDSRLIDVMVADFGLDLLQFNDEIRLGTIVDPPHYDKDKVANTEYIKNAYSEASKSPNGRAMLEVNSMVMVERIEERLFANKPEDLPFVSGAYEIFLKKHGIDLPPLNSSDEKVLMSALAQTARLAYIGKDIGIREIDDDKASEWRDFHQDDNQLSNSTINKYLDHVAAAFRWAANRQRKYVEFNPFDKKQLPDRSLL